MVLWRGAPRYQNLRAARSFCAPRAWVRLMEAKRERQKAQVGPAVLSDGRKAGPQHQESGINAASRDLGLKRTNVQCAVKIAERLTPDKKGSVRSPGSGFLTAFSLRRVSALLRLLWLLRPQRKRPRSSSASRCRSFYGEGFSLPGSRRGSTPTMASVDSAPRPKLGRQAGGLRRGS
jgi:hypothetical protein